MNTCFEKNAFIRAREKKQCINLGQEIEFRHWGVGDSTQEAESGGSWSSRKTLFTE